jgi:Fe2+ or Zn2+ uptake regulation protein
MDAIKVISALDSELRREILKILAERPSTVVDVLHKLKGKGLNVKYRETVYRALQILVDSGLVEKYYEKEKGLCYRLVVNNITIKIAKDSVDIGN